MKIKTIINQHRQDFTAIYECHCGHKEEGGGYDDAYFHNEVIPMVKCKKCGEVAGEDYRPSTPKYAPHEVV